MLAPHFASDVPLVGVRAQRSSSRPELVSIGNRKWGAVAVQVQESEGCTRLLVPFKPDSATLLVMLEEVAGHAEIRQHPDRSPPSAYRGKDHLSFVPAGTDAWVSARDVRYLRQV